MSGLGTLLDGDRGQRGQRGQRGRRGLVAGALVLALLLALWAIAGRASATAEEEWSAVQREDLVLGIEVSGTLKAVESAQLGPPSVPNVWDFKIAFMAPEGTEVRPGQPVLGFDTSELEQTLLQKMAERDSAQKELEKRETNVKISRGDTALQLAEAEARYRKAALKVEVPPDIVASKELAQSRADRDLAAREMAYYKSRLRLQETEGGTEIDGLRKKRDRAAERVAEAEDAIRRMMVTAPRAGTVVYASNFRNEKKKVGDSCWRGENVLEIPNLRSMKAEGQVDEADAGRLAVGQPVSLRLDAHPDVAFTGRVRALRSSVQKKSFRNPLKVVGLEIALDRTDPQRMRPGMRFLGTVELERVRGALVIPAEAVVNTPDGPVVYRRAGWNVQEVRPTLGRRNARQVEVVEGLSAGDQVALRGGGPDEGAPEGAAPGGSGNVSGGVFVRRVG